MFVMKSYQLRKRNMDVKGEIVVSINPLIRIEQLFDSNDDIVPIVSGEDKYLYDLNGKKYVDFCGGIWNVPFGYSNPQINKKIEEQLHKLPFCSVATNVADIQYHYARRLCNVLAMSALIYTCSGSECIEAAIKACRKYQALKGRKRKGISAFCLSYHGTTYGAMSVSGVDQGLTEDFFPLVNEIKWITLPTELEREEGWLSTIEEHIDEYGEELAGIIIEPVLGSGGIVPVPPKVLQRLEQLCKEKDILLVDDEVTTGFGRTGVPFVYKKYNLNPDLVCLSKGITNGYLPLGVLAFSDNVTELFAEKRATFEHFSTQGGNLLSIAAADAVLDMMKKYEQYDVEGKGAYFVECLKEEFANCSSIQVRGSGMMIGLSFHKDLDSHRLFEVQCRLREHGILVYCFNNPGYNIGLSFFPPFTTTRDEFKNIAHKIAKQIKYFPDILNM